MQKITPFLWFDDQAEEAANFYVSIFKNSKIVSVTRYGEAGPRARRARCMTVDVRARRPGVHRAQRRPAVQVQRGDLVRRELRRRRQEIDYYWEKLSAGGDPKAQQCGWLKDKYGLSWQIVPDDPAELLDGPGRSAGRVMKAMMPMKKLDIATLKKASDGG